MPQNESNIADYVAEFLVQLGLTNVHGLMGGGASGLNDGFIQNPNINYLCYHHEQSAGYASLGEIRLNKRWAVLNPTTGCGGTNCYTPVLNAWQDSLPLVVVSGNVNLSTCSSYLNSKHQLQLRAFGIQEHDIISSVKPITKFAVLLEEWENIEKVLVEAFLRSEQGRRGPCWIDIPADLQHIKVPKEYFSRIPEAIKQIQLKLESYNQQLANKAGLALLLTEIKQSKRPLLLVGGGVANDLVDKKAVRDFVLEHKVPVVATYSGTDVVEHDCDQYLGCVGVKGNRAANFAVQNCDLLIVLGSRLAFGAIGYDIENFARNATICIVDPDQNELDKNTILFGNRVIQARGFAREFIDSCQFSSRQVDPDWLDKCKKTKLLWNTIEENKRHFNYTGVSIYHVIEELNAPEYDNCNFVIDAGSISYVGPTTLKYRRTSNFIFSPGQADMGCALPTSLGVAANSEKWTVCVTGDGSFMSNMQELASLSHHQAKITVLILNNGGYLSISNTQRNNYGENRVFGEHEGRGITFPDFKLLAKSFGLTYTKIDTVADLQSISALKANIIEITCEQSETIAPFQARIDGKQAGAHDMAPFLDKAELQRYSSVSLPFAR